MDAWVRPRDALPDDRTECWICVDGRVFSATFRTPDGEPFYEVIMRYGVGRSMIDRGVFWDGDWPHAPYTVAGWMPLGRPAPIAYA